ncbi:MAG: hypothetical protein O7H39_06670 [Gammaproteobacteria bacterium]|nr:hypothetical protein [Gammaproteobacteria bacterium]
MLVSLENSPKSDIVLNLPDTDALLDSAWPDCEKRAAVPLQTPWRDDPDTTLDVRYTVSRNNPDSRNAPEAITATIGDAFSVDLHAPVKLLDVTVEKPWGHERWLSGMEQRGESKVTAGEYSVPISHYLALAPRRLLGADPLILLKILEATEGDLYLELHETKSEVYVVTGAEDGCGMRFGIDPSRRAKFDTDTAFRTAFIAAASAYEHNADANTRAELDSFTRFHILRRGNVVSVPPGVPHSLQQGVQVIEFQTPVFERKILAAHQPVATQDHWDTAAAVERMVLDALSPFTERSDGFSVRVEPIHAAQPLEIDVPAYVIGMVVAGQVRIGGITCGPSEAFFVPASAGAQSVQAANEAVVAYATPRPPATRTTPATPAK